MLALVRYSVISVAKLWFYLSYLTYLLNGRQMLTYYPLLILNVFAMIPEKHYYCWNVKGGWKTFFSFLEKMTSRACLLGSGLKLIFHWKAHCFILERSILSSKVLITESWIMEKREASSAKSLVLEDKLWFKSLIYIENNNGPRMES